MQKNFLIIENDIPLKDIIVENVIKYFDSKLKIDFQKLNYSDSLQNFRNIDLSIINFSYFKSYPIPTLLKKKNSKNNLILIFDNGFERYENKNFLDYYFVIKPFKLKKIFNIISDIFIPHETYEKLIYLSEELIFKPDTKVIFNKIKNDMVSLTEKESKLLNYLFQNKEKILNKHDILTNVWGINENVNTHTLETHIYSLKKKVDALDLNVNFKFSDQSGGYFFHKI